MEITLQYFEGCPNWKITEQHLNRLIANGLQASLAYELVDTEELAIERGFRGSPTVLIDGVDPFAEAETPLGVACRVYRTEKGPAGSPTIDQLRDAIGRREG